MSDNATAEGSYVAITRARERTDLYSSIDPAEPSDGTDWLQALAERMSRTEPEVPSIDIPLRHEISVTMEPEQPDTSRSPIARGEEPIVEQAPSAAELRAAELRPDTDRTHERNVSVDDAIADPQSEQPEAPEAEGRHRRWPRGRQPDAGREMLEADREVEPTHRTHSWGWEP